MLLANRFGEWCLAAFANHIQGCNLSVNHPPRRDAEKYHNWRGTVRVWSHAPLEGIIFYPTLRLLGCQVWPRGWKDDSTDPILHCMMGNWWISLAESPQVIEERKRKLHDLGLRGDIRDGLFGLIHVDELEKIEGPPPEGPF